MVNVISRLIPLVDCALETLRLGILRKSTEYGRCSIGELTATCEEAEDYLLSWKSLTLSSSSGIYLWPFVGRRNLAPAKHMSVIFQHMCSTIAAWQTGALFCRQKLICPLQPPGKFSSLLWKTSPLIFLRQCFPNRCSHEQCIGARGDISSFPNLGPQCKFAQSRLTAGSSLAPSDSLPSQAQSGPSCFQVRQRVFSGLPFPAFWLPRDAMTAEWQLTP